MDNNEAHVNLKDLSLFLKSKLPERQEFLIKFKELEYLSNRSKYRPQILYALSKLIPPNGAGLSVDYEKLTIEHLIPQSEIKSGNADEKLVASIGNLILIDTKTNSDDLKNKSPLEKIKILKSIGFPLKENFLPSDLTEWNSDLIEKRTDMISEAIYDFISTVVLK